MGEEGGGEDLLSFVKRSYHVHEWNLFDSVIEVVCACVCMCICELLGVEILKLSLYILPNTR